MDTGGLAQMTYQPNFNNAIGASHPGFASRGKGTHIKRLSVAPPSKISPIDETQQVNPSSTPRTARGHLLAGLRTAPKSASLAPTMNGSGLESSRYASPPYGNRVPQTSTAAFFPNGVSTSSNNQAYSLPEVLAPPALDFASQGVEHIDQDLYNELVATNNYLAQQQRALQQQLLNVQAAAHQFGGMNLNTNLMGPQQFQSPISPMSIYDQQMQQGLQPVVSAVPGSPGVFSVYNPMTGQSSYVFDNSAVQQQQSAGIMSPPLSHHSVSPPPMAGSNLQRQSPDAMFSPSSTRSRTPPKSTPSPQQEVEPLPPPSANAFRRGHQKNKSSVNIKTGGDWVRNGPRSSGIAQTPMTGTFAPGHGRAGEHPVRQPRGPPLLQELQEKPTSKHDGSKNFATRQRRRAVHDLVKAGRERRSENRQPGSGSGTPASEAEFNFSVSSDNDELLARSATLSSKPSLGSLRAAVNGAIGSERKEKSRERSSVGSNGELSAKSLSSDESMVEVEMSRRKTPLLA